MRIRLSKQKFGDDQPEPFVLRRFACLIGSILLAFSACSTQAGSGETSKPTAQVSEVPGVELDVAGDIPAIDFAIDERESLHVVWRAVISDNERPALNSDKILYARGEKGGASWSQPISIGDNLLADPARILSGPNGLHILFGGNLRHFASGDGGKTWQESAPLIPNHESRADAFDAVVADNRLVVVYLYHPKPAYDVDKRTAKDDQKLYVVRWSPGEVSAPLPLASFPSSINDPPPPRIVADGKRIHLMCGVNAERHNGTALGVQGRLSYLRSEDAGSTWSSPVAASSDASKGATSSGTGQIQTIGSIELLSTPERLYAFYHDTLFFVTHTKDGFNWSPAVELGRRGRTMSSADFHSDSVSVGAIGDRGLVAWIDTRFRRSDRRGWNPLGGTPWSDEPDWKNNDVLTIPLSDVLALSSEYAQVKAVSDPARLTEQLSYAASVRVRASNTRLFVLWSGRSRVGKRLDAYGEKPRIFYITLAL